MNNQDILQKAIEKVIKNGFIFPHDVDGVIKWKVIQAQDIYVSVFIRVKDYKSFDADTEFEHKYSVSDIIFDHDFAEKLWGEKKSTHSGSGKCLHCKGDISISNPSGFCNHVYYPEYCNICRAKTEDWKFHLQEIVLEDDPIKYLESYV